MSTNPAHSAYVLLVTNSPALPEAALRAAYQSSIDTSDTQLLRTLAGRPDTPADVIDALHTSRLAPVQAALRSRVATPGAKAATPAPGTERRTAVLAAALASASPSPAVYAEAIAAYCEKPTQALRQHVGEFATDYFTPDQAYRTLVHLRSPSGVRRVRGLVARLGPQRAEALLQEPTAFWATDYVLRHHFPTDATLRILRAAAHRAKEVVALGGAPDHFVWALQAALEIRPRAERHDIIAQISKHVDRRAVSLRGAMRLVESTADVLPARGPLDWDARPTRTPASPADLSELGWRGRAALAASPDPQTLHTLVALTLAPGSLSDLALFTQVALRNRALSTEDRHAILRTFQEEWNAEERAEASFDDYLADVDLIAAFPDDPVTVQAWAALFPVQVLARHGWGPFGGSAAAPAVIAEWQAHPGGRTKRLRALAETSLTRDQLRAIRMEFLPIILKSAQACDLLSAVLADALGPDRAAWDTYANLASHLDVTLGELLDVCTGIAQ